MESRGNAVAYTGGTTHRPIPHAATTPRRGTHTPTAPKKAGLDWDALKPTCKGCGEKSSQLGEGALCPACRGTVEVKVTRPQYAAEDVERRYVDNTRLGRELAELEETDPKVAAAADSLALVVDQITHPDDHVDPAALDPETPQAVEEAPSPRDEVEPQPEQLTIPVGAGAAPAPRPAVPTPAQELNAQITHATRVLRDTADLDNPTARLLRLNALSAIEALHLFTQMYPQTTEPRSTGSSAEKPEGGASKGKAARPPATRRVMGDWTGQAKKPRATPATSARNIDIPEARRLYFDELLTPPQIAERLGSTAAGIRRALKANGIELRDDRKGHSGSKARQYPADMIDAVRHLYLDEHLTIDGVAERLATTHKIVATIMRRHDIPRRPDAFDPSSPRRDNAVQLKARMVELGLTSRQVKDWALDHGLVEDIRVGLPSARLVEAYVAAHAQDQAS